MKKHSLAQTQAWAKENDIKQFIHYDPKERRNKFKKDYGYRRKPNRPTR